MPNSGKVYDETRVFMEGVRVVLDPGGNQLFPFQTISKTVDGQLLRAILTLHAVQDSRDNLDRALAEFHRRAEGACVVYGRFGEG
jgi:hypothetical protein